jgi:hypothetical protein
VRKEKGLSLTSSSGIQKRHSQINLSEVYRKVNVILNIFCIPSKYICEPRLHNGPKKEATKDIFGSIGGKFEIKQGLVVIFLGVIKYSGFAESF